MFLVAYRMFFFISVLERLLGYSCYRHERFRLERQRLKHHAYCNQIGAESRSREQKLDKVTRLQISYFERRHRGYLAKMHQFMSLIITSYN